MKDVGEFNAAGGKFDWGNCEEPPADWLDNAAPPEGEEAPPSAPATPAPAPACPVPLQVPAGWLAEAPPPERLWLQLKAERFRSSAFETKVANLLPLARLGKLGLLVSPGGVGKSQALIQLAIATATGRDWLDIAEVAPGAAGPVLLVLGEEDEGEIRRRLHRAFNALGLRDEDRERIAERLFVLGLAGSNCQVLRADRLSVKAPGGGLRSYTQIETTDFGAALAAHAAGIEGLRAVLIDPASRFMPGEAEVDNAIATRFVEWAENLTKMPAAPAVLICHHTNKSALSGKIGSQSQGDARGSSGLVDGARLVMGMRTVWQPVIDPFTSKPLEPRRLVEWAVTKTNYGPGGMFEILDPAGGVLRWAAVEHPYKLQDSRADAFEAAKKAAEKAAGDTPAPAKAKKGKAKIQLPEVD